MKKNIIFSLLLMGTALLVTTSCSEDDLSDQSVIKTSTQQRTDLDNWLEVNYLRPYNIQVKYRYEYNEIDEGYYTVPCSYEMAVKMAHILKYTCIDAYTDKVGIAFVRTYFPKLFIFEGEFHYRNNGSFELGTAEGGKKINLMGLNHIDELGSSIEGLNNYFLHVIHHEFTHILHQTTNYSAAYQLITLKEYKSDKCFNSEFSDYLSRGFITAYAQQAADEDFAEMYSNYVTNTAEQWEAWMKQAEHPALRDADGNLQFEGGELVYDMNAKANGRDLIEQKLDILRAYMSSVWNIDLDVMRESILGREQDIIDGKIDLTTTEIK